MCERITQKTQIISQYIMPSLFFLGNIKFFKMILAYLGVTSGITIIAVTMFAVLSAILLYYFLHKIISEKKHRMLVLVVAINIVYGLPYLMTGMYYELVQYCVFMVPFTIAAYLVVFDKNGLTRFFNCMRNISRFGVWVFFTYLIVLFICEPGEYGIVEIKEMSYGDIAYAALPFFLTDMEQYFIEDDRKTRFYTGFRVLVYLAVLIYTGTRSAIVCMGVAIVLQVFRNVKNILRMGFRRSLTAIITVTLCTLFCLTVIPAGARLNVVKGNALHELMGRDVSTIFSVLPNADEIESETIVDESEITSDETMPNDTVVDEADLNESAPEQSVESFIIEQFSSYPISYVYNVTTGQFVDISDAFEYYVVNGKRTISQTEYVLRRDIIDNSGEYIIVNPGYYANAVEYSLPINSRVVLWSTAWNEFCSAPMIGNGPLHYQQKYEGTFPHNLVLEIMVDYGLVGTAIVAIIVLYCYLRAIVIAVKTSDRLMGEMLIMLTMYIPMHLLYHSLYSNGIFIFTICSLIFFVIKHSRAIVAVDQSNAL